MCDLLRLANPSCDTRQNPPQKRQNLWQFESPIKETVQAPFYSFSSIYVWQLPHVLLFLTSGLGLYFIIILFIDALISWWACNRLVFILSGQSEVRESSSLIQSSDRRGVSQTTADSL